MQNIEYKSIIKNLDKYGEITLARGIVMDNKDKTLRENATTGISTKQFGKYWYYLGENKVIFKSFECMQRTRLNRIVNELLFYEISKQIGLDCAKCELATMNDITGIVSYSVLGKDERLITASKLKMIAGFDYFENSLSIYHSTLKALAQKGYVIDLQKETLNLFKLCLIDELLLHTDRHSGNINFIENTKTNEIRLAPIFDNEFAFCSFNLNIINSDFDTIDFELLKSFFNDSENIFSVKRIDYAKPKYEQIKDDLISFANKNEDAKKILLDILDKIDIKSAIENVEKLGIQISTDYKDFITMITCESVKEFEKTMYFFKKIESTNEIQR